MAATMKVTVRKLFALCAYILLLNVVNGHNANDDPPLDIVKPERGALWPMPSSVKSSTSVLSIGESFQFISTGQTCDIIDAAFARYYKYIFGIDKADDKLRFRSFRTFVTAPGNLGSLSVHLSSPCERYPSLEMKESYNLIISETAGKSVLSSDSVWGILRGLETFSQLTYHSDSRAVLINATRISDTPRFSYRGILLDTSRHFLPKFVILQNLEAMAQNKFNVFHWHIVDDPSFPYESFTYPDLSKKGSYQPETHVYTQRDVQEIIEYARMRGIRVVPEFDSPGHTQSWGKGQPGLLTKCYTKGAFNGNYGPVDPSKNSTYTFLAALIKEVFKVFPDKYIHLGGDEVSFNCWLSNSDVMKFVKDHGWGTNVAKLEQYYIQKVLNIVNDLHKDDGYIIWQEVIDKAVKVKSDTIVEVWKGNYQAELAKVTKAGLRTILSSCWYLNEISYGIDWPKYYKCDPQDFPGDASQKKLIIGGEACMWGEYVDGTNLISRLWPRASAIAERLWSPASYKNPNAAAGRLEEHRCRMLNRGLNVEPINGPGFCRQEVTRQ
ncbi:beta-hexosaminidase subunit beta-like [Tubulanus polymorphus]|uniref:beta-hexosaminidase subunit beta-like n=1 Tax=Tubulanus polymorphus TaxID=672921 RepID=UPI003DA51F21